jgi:PPK2 family polyphosphate:nucleotide phosphotransferase
MAKAFRRPTPEELRHDFLWRIRRALPPPGVIGTFDRSHYEDVVTARVEGLADLQTVMLRYPAINRFEEELVAGGTTVVKCFLHISVHEQKARLLRRLDRPDKRWKFNPGDIDARAKWDDYQAAYTEALRRCSTEAAPWYVVPADRKWYRNWAVMNIMIAALDAMDLQWPQPDFDVEEQRRRLLAGG